ncbi:MAG: hydrogenase iron-sulfur subunit [Promethearchaeota archaeon]
MVRTGYFDLPAIFEGYEVPEREDKKTSGDFESLIVCYFCRWCTSAAADLAGTSRMQYPPNVRIITLPCTGKVDPLYVLTAFEKGADGVIVSGCIKQQCHYIDGNYKAERRIIFLKDILEEIGFGGNRLSMHFISASMAPTLVETVNEAVERIKKLGPNPIK